MAEERRLVTILFADVTGATALGETLDPEDVRALMAHPVSADLTQRIAALAAEFNYPVLEAQARRALSVMAKNQEELARAVVLFRKTGAVPYEVRARCERAIVVGDDSEFAAAQRDLEEIGDIDQLETPSTRLAAHR